VQQSDSQLLEQFLKPDADQHKIFKLIVLKYQEKVYWHLRRMLLIHADTDDVMQDTFIKVWKALPDFRMESSLYTWIYRIATNEALSFIKRKNRMHILSNEGSMDYISESFSSDVYFDGDDFQTKFQLALLQLPDKQKLVFNMKYFDEMKYEDMSVILDTSVGALKASYHHAVKKIEAIVREN
jgi:RNA polymerase sigma factor (sigma-70 family)